LTVDLQRARYNTGKIDADVIDKTNKRTPGKLTNNTPYLYENSDDLLWP
jgi:hypothetical protein